MSRILIVDDSHDLRVLVEAYLKSVGHTVTLANDGEEGVRAATGQPPDLILTDFQMPRLDGFGLFGAVRSDPRTAHVPVIMLTAHNRREMLGKALRAGVDDFLGKPFKKEELLDAVAVALKGAASAAEAAGPPLRLLAAPPARPSGAALSDAHGTVLSCELCLEPLAAGLTADELDRVVSHFYREARELLGHHGGRILWFTQQRFIAVFDEANRTHQGSDVRRALRASLLLVLAAQRLRSWAGRRFPGRMLPELAVAVGVGAGAIDERSGPGGSWVGGAAAELSSFLARAARPLGWSIVVPQDVASRALEFVTGRTASVPGAKSGDVVDIVEIVGLPGGEQLVTREQQLYALAEAAVERNGTLLRTAGSLARRAAAPGTSAGAPRPDFEGHRIIRKLAENGLLSVFLVEAEDGPRVLKMVFVDDKQRAAALERRLEQRPAAAAVKHPNVARVYGQGLSGANVCIETEYCPGGDLRNLIAERMIAGDVVKALLRLCAGLKAAHEQGVFHGDLSAANVRIRADGSLAIADFQVPDIVERASGSADSGVMARSPHYLAPELINGLEADAQTDLYSLGILLHEMLTGARPYASNDLSQILVHQLKSPVPRLPEAVSRFQPLLDRLMAKERNDRFASVQEAITFMARSKLAA